MTDTDRTGHPAPEDLAAYLLDGDDAAVAAHVASCAACAEEARSLSATLGALALAAPPAEPGAELRERILAAAAAPAAPAPVVDLAAARHRRRRIPLLAVAAAAAVLLALVLGPLRDRGFDVERQVALPGIGRVEVDGDRARLASERAAAPAGSTYQVWIIRDGAATSGGTYDAAGTVAITGRVRPGDVIAVTVEPAGGSPQPTSEPLATATV